MIEIETQIDIATSPARVWRALCDFQAYPRWNPYREVLGEAVLGRKVVLLIGPDPRKRRRLRATISILEPIRVLAFDSGMGFLARSTESFILAPSRRGTLLRHRAMVGGIAAMQPLRKWFLRRLPPVYRRMDQAFATYLAAPRRAQRQLEPRRRGTVNMNRPASRRGP